MYRIDSPGFPRMDPKSGYSSMFNRDEARSLAVSAVTSDIYLAERFVVLPPPPPRYSFNKQPRKAKGYTRVQIIERSLALSRSFTVLCVVKTSLGHGHASVFPPSKAVYLWPNDDDSRNEMVPYSGIPLEAPLSTPSPSLLFHH